jgi:hypothetical protein
MIVRSVTFVASGRPVPANRPTTPNRPADSHRRRHRGHRAVEDKWRAESYRVLTTGHHILRTLREVFDRRRRGAHPAAPYHNWDKSPQRIFYQTWSSGPPSTYNRICRDHSVVFQHQTHKTGRGPASAIARLPSDVPDRSLHVDGQDSSLLITSSSSRLAST